MKKLLALFLAASLCVSAFASCQAAPQESSKESSKVDSSEEEKDTTNMDGDIQLSEPGEFPIVLGDKVTLTAFTAPQIETCNNFDYGTNTYTTQLEDLTNIHIDWTVVSTADKVAKLNLLFQSSDYQDLIFGTMWDAATQFAYGSQGFLIPLDEYMENDAYYYNIWKDAIFETGTCSEQEFNTIVMADGHTYSMPFVNDAVNAKYAQRVWIYQEWLDTLGLEAPTTTEEFKKVLEAFKNDDPNGNGQADEIPFTGATTGWYTNPTTWLMNSFVYYDTRHFAFADNGEVKMAFADEGYKDALNYFYDLAKDDLLYSETYLQDNTMLKALTTGEDQRVGVVAGGLISQFTSYVDGQEGDWTNWQPLAPLEGPNGVQYTYYQPAYPSAKLHITDLCETPKTAFRLADALYEEKQGMNVVNGPEGKYWKYAEEGEIGINGEQAIYQRIITASSGSTETNYMWSQIGPGYTFPGYHSGQAIIGDPTLSTEAGLYKQAMMYAEFTPDADTVVPPLVFSDEDSKTVVDLKTTINEYVTQMFTDVLQNGDADGKWDAYLQGLEDRGLSQLIELYQAAYDAQK